MYCMNCGNKLDDDSKFCTSCGTKVGEKYISLTITRIKSAVGMAISFKVYVDGNQIGVLKNGTSLTCDIIPGNHQVVISSFEKDVIQNIVINEDTQSVEIITNVKMGLLTGKAGIKEVIYK